MSPHRTLPLLLLASSAGLFAAGWGPQRAEQSLRWVMQEQLSPALCLSRLDASLKNARAHLNAGYVHDPAIAAARLHTHPITLHTQAIRDGVLEARALWRDYRAMPHGSEELPLMLAVERGIAELVELTLVPGADALDAAQYDRAAAAVTPSYLSYQRTEAAIQRLQQLSERRVQTAIDELAQERARWRWAALLPTLLAIGLGAWSWRRARVGLTTARGR